MSKFEWIFEKVMEAQKNLETTHLHVSVDFTIDDLKDALIETNGIIAEKDKEITELKSKFEDLQNTYKESVEIKLQIWERCKKAEADASETQALLEERNSQIGKLIDDARHQKLMRCQALAESCKYKKYYMTMLLDIEGSSIVSDARRAVRYLKKEKRAERWRNKLLTLIPNWRKV